MGFFDFLKGKNKTDEAFPKPKGSAPSPKGSADAGTVTDADGNVYHTVKIGNQVWTVENLKMMKYNDGTLIPLVTDKDRWANLTTPAYCWYDNDINHKSKYGALYNWYAVNTKKLAPKGWHVPTDAEWGILEEGASGFFMGSPHR